MLIYCGDQNLTRLDCELNFPITITDSEENEIIWSLGKPKSNPKWPEIRSERRHSAGW